MLNQNDKLYLEAVMFLEDVYGVSIDSGTDFINTAVIYLQDKQKIDGNDCIQISNNIPEYIKEWFNATRFNTVAHMEGAMMALNKFVLSEESIPHDKNE